MRREYDILVVPWRQDRFSRDPEDIKHLLRTFIVLGIAVWIEGRLLDSREAYKSERMMIGIRAEVSGEELAKLHDATRRGMKAAKKNGKRTGQVPTGFDYMRNADGEADGSGRIALNALGTAGLPLIDTDYGEIAESLGIARTTAWRLKRNLVAFQKGNLDEVLWNGSEGSRKKNEENRIKEDAERSAMKTWLKEIAPEAEFEFK
jgi:DNA invertase Pin-like site-specific DNA recombinase